MRLGFAWLSVCLLAACGGAVEFGGAWQNSTNGAAVGDNGRAVLQQYDVYVDPLAGNMQYAPVGTLSQLRQMLFLGPSALSQTLGATDVQLVSGYASSIYDTSDNKIRLSGHNNKGLCLKNTNAAGKNYTGFLIRLHDFTSTSVFGSEGAVSDGQSGYTVDYGDAVNGDTVCRSLAIGNISSVAYRFLLNFEATLTTNTPKGYMTYIDSTGVVTGLEPAYTKIHGNGFTYNGTPTVSIGGTQINPSFVDVTDTLILLTTDPSVAGLSGELSIDTGNGVYHGPYIHSTGVISAGVALQGGEVLPDARLFFRTGGKDFSVDVNGCPSSSGMEDSEIVNHAALSGTASTQQMSFLSTGGVDHKVYVAVDVDNSGTLNAGDHYTFIENDHLLPTSINKPLNPMSAGMGDGFSCVLSVKKRILCWGRNDSGQLGDGTTLQRLFPVEVQLPADASALTVGAAHACAMIDGGAWCWGAGFQGQLGSGGFANSSTPVQVVGLDKNVTRIAAGDYHTCAIQNGTIYCWGTGDNGQLGDGLFTTSDVPVATNGPDGKASDITAGNAFTCAVIDDSPYCWGLDDYGQLGLGIFYPVGDDPQQGTPVGVFVNGNPWQPVSIVAGGAHTCMISAAISNSYSPGFFDFGLYCWGSNDSGQLGNAGAGSFSRTAVAVAGMENSVSHLSAGLASTCAVQSEMTYCWGNLLFTNQSSSPGVQSNLDSATSEVFISKQSDNRCGIKNNQLYCWGTNSYGEFGNGQAGARAAPVAVSGLGSGITAYDSDADQNYNCIVQNGGVKCWGGNTRGRLGDGTTTGRLSPVAVSGLGSGVTAMSTGMFFGCAVQSGAAKCWGANLQGALGDGTTTDRFTPVTVSGLSSGVTAISGGVGHACAIQSGALYCWGWNNRGQLGDGTTTDRYTPVAVTGMGSGVTAVSAGDDITCAIKSGAAYCWGNNSAGQLGDGTTNTPLTTASAVVGLGANVSAISTSRYPCAIQSGAAKCWGNYMSSAFSTTPVTLTGLSSGVTSITAGGSGGCALQNGSVYCWDSAWGDGSFAVHSTPTAVPGLDQGDVTALFLGSYRKCAYRGNQLYCWGYLENSLGDGTSVYVSTPQVNTFVENLQGVNLPMSRNITATCP